MTRGVGPQGEGLGKTKRDRFLTCPLKHRGETQFRRKFFWFLFFQEKELPTFFFKESRLYGALAEALDHLVGEGDGRPALGQILPVEPCAPTQFEGGRHARRVGLMMDIEKE